jgi:hypothetical protein
MVAVLACVPQLRLHANSADKVTTSHRFQQTAMSKNALLVRTVRFSLLWDHGFVRRVMKMNSTCS